MTSSVTAAAVLDFWFHGDPAIWRFDPWFKKNDAYDLVIRTRFGTAVQAAQDGVLDGWTATPEGTLALLLVLDQFARNIHRGSHLAFAGDAHARGIARKALDGGIEASLTAVQRVFVYLPLEHSEHLPDQELCLRLMKELSGFRETREMHVWAEKHLVIIRRFARFPHRNVALGRASTAEETEFLKQPGSGF